MATGSRGCSEGVPIGHDAEALWGYDMKMGGPATAHSLFLVLGIILIYQLAHARNRNTKYMWILVVATLAEEGGYAAAIHTVKENCRADVLDGFMAAQMMIILMPNLIEAAMYITASKVSSVGQVPRTHFWLRPSFLTWFYTMSDVLTILIQASGMGIWGSSRANADAEESDKNSRDPKTGAWIVVAGLIAQIASQTIFLFELLYIHKRVDRGYAKRPEARALFFSIYWIWTFLQIRNIFRTVAFIQRAVTSGPNSAGSGAAEIQPAFFILEPLMIVLSVAMSAIFPAGYLLPRWSIRKAEKDTELSWGIGAAQVASDVHDVEMSNPSDVKDNTAGATRVHPGVFVNPEVPPWLQFVMRPFVAWPWLGYM